MDNFHRRAISESNSVESFRIFSLSYLSPSFLLFYVHWRSVYNLHCPFVHPWFFFYFSNFLFFIVSLKFQRALFLLDVVIFVSLFVFILESIHWVVWKLFILCKYKVYLAFYTRNVFYGSLHFKMVILIK